MAEGRGPEEFFEVFRSVQSGRKKRDDRPATGAPPVDGAEPAAAPAPAAEGEPLGPRLWERDVTVSLPVVALAVLSAVLVAVAAYLLGRQQGWRSHAAAQAAKGEAAAKGTGLTTAAPAATVFSTEPELTDGKVFTMVTYGATAKDRDRAKQEAEYLNGYRLFTQTLKLQAYVWTDKQKRHRLCARGLNVLSLEERESVKKQVGKLKSATGKTGYYKPEYDAP